MKNLANPDAAARRRFDWIACIALVALAILLYLPNLGATFVYDSKLTVRGNDYVHHLGNLWDVATLRVMHLDVMDNNRPVYLASVMLNWALWGGNAMGHHLCNIVLHSAVVALLYLFCRALLPGASPWAPFGATLLFLAHPQDCEAVAEMSYRNELMAAAFTLAAMNLAARFQPVWSRRNLLVGTAIVTCAFLAIGSKENGIVVAPMLVCYWLLFRRGEPRTGWIALCAGAALVAGLFLVARFTLRPAVSVIFVSAPSRPVADLFDNLFIVQPKIWAFYLRQIVWPRGFCADYGWFSVSRFNSTTSLFCVLGVLGVQCFASFYSRGFGVGMALYWLALLPVSNIVPIYRPMADRFMYLPMVGVAIMLASLPWPRGVAGKTVLVLAMCASCVLAFFTIQREKVWHDGVALWTDSAMKNPMSQDCWNNLGAELYEAGRPSDAIPMFYRAMYIVNGKEADHYAELALALDAAGSTREADAAFKKCIALDPRYAHTALLLQALIWEKSDADKLQAIADRNKGP